MPRRTKAEYEEQLMKVVRHLRSAETEIRKAYQEFLVAGPKTVAKEFGESWLGVLEDIEEHIQTFDLGVEKLNYREFLFRK